MGAHTGVRSVIQLYSFFQNRAPYLRDLIKYSKVIKERKKKKAQRFEPRTSGLQDMYSAVVQQPLPGIN